MTHQLQADVMAPDSQPAIHDTSPSPFQDSTDPSVLLTLMAIGPTATPPSVLSTPLFTGILTKGSKVKKRVSFRDSNLVMVREIPPRSPCSSSSEGEEEDSDEEDDSGSSDSDEDSEDSDSEEEDEEVEGKGTRGPSRATTSKSSTTSRDKPVPKTRSSPAPPKSSFSSLRARADRVPASAANASNVTSAKGSYHVTSSPANRVVSLVSQITGVSSAATQTHIKQRNAAAAASKSATPSKQVTAVLKVEKKVKGISPTVDNVATSQTVRSVQNKDGASAVALSRGVQGKGAKKKRVPHSLRRQDGVEKRKPVTQRKTKESKSTTKGSDGNVNGHSARVKCRVVVNGLSEVRDSVTLPPLNSDNSVVLHSSKPLPHTAARKTPIFGLNGFIFPGDPASDLVKLKHTTAKAEDTKLALSALRTTTSSSPREQMSTVPPGSAGRRKRCYAWQMANGDLENSLQEPPSITPMWETVTAVSSETAQPPSLPNR